MSTGLERSCPDFKAECQDYWRCLSLTGVVWEGLHAPSPWLWAEAVGLAGLTNDSRDAVWLLRLDPRRSDTQFVHRKPCIGELCLMLNSALPQGCLFQGSCQRGEAEEPVVPDARF